MGRHKMAMCADDLPSQLLTAMFFVRKNRGHFPKVLFIDSRRSREHKMKRGVWELHTGGIWSWRGN